jgi:hypothetical protein
MWCRPVFPQAPLKEGLQMRHVKSTYFAVVCALGLGWASAAHAITCPGGSPTTGNTYTIVQSTGCAFGGHTGQNGNQQFTTTTIPTIEGTNGIYYGGSFGTANISDPAVPAAVVPGLDKIDTPTGGVTVGDQYISFTVNETRTGGTFTFLQALTDVFLALKDGAQPFWAVFTLGSVTVGPTYDWSMTGGQLSHFVLFGTPSEVPLPPALILFGTALAGMTLLRRRRERTSQSGEITA